MKVLQFTKWFYMNIWQKLIEVSCMHARNEVNYEIQYVCKFYFVKMRNFMHQSSTGLCDF